MRRWFAWTFRCLRGRRCADLVFTELSLDGVPPGTTVDLDYTCSTCRTRYRRPTLAGDDGAFTHGDRVRVA